MKTIAEIIKHWDEQVNLLEHLITSTSPDSDMMCIMISRKNQLIECNEELKKLQKETAFVPKECRKKILTKEQADKIVCRDEITGLNTGRKTGLQRVSYYCKECKGWHTSTMTPNNPNLKL